MTQFHATTTVAGAVRAEALSDALDALDPPPVASGVHDRDDGSGLWEVGAYFDSRPDAAGLAVLAAAHSAADFSVAPVGTRDWLAQVRAGLAPVEAGRFTVFGSHDRARVAPNRIGLEIEAALAFGTGHHATTRGCLLALDGLARAGRRHLRVADIGTGTGVLAMAAARLWRPRVLAADVDPTATATARMNLAANRAAAGVRALTAPGFRHPALHAGAPYDLVLANILAAPLRRLAPEVARHMAGGGILVLSGLLDRQAAGVLAVYGGWGFRRRRAIRLDGWTTLVLERERGRPRGAAVGGQRPARGMPMSSRWWSLSALSAASAARELRQRILGGGRRRPPRTRPRCGRGARPRHRRSRAPRQLPHRCRSRHR
jgi:ribosomal protein L11 methyltransferase